MIVVAVLGILAAIVVPQFQAHSKQAREAVAKDSVRLLRGAIELYTANATGQFGWVYQPATKTISLDWTGTDKNTIQYFDY